MLLYQGIIAYELWNQVVVTEEQADLVYDRLYEAIHPSGDNIVLIGFMGSGKTTIGHRIEKKYGYTFIDTDAYIEEREGRSISQIFAEEGEEYFRQLETVVLQELIMNTRHGLIATACGFHASDPVVMSKTVKSAVKNQVRIGAHPGFPDLMGFGRRNLESCKRESEPTVTYM